VAFFAKCPKFISPPKFHLLVWIGLMTKMHGLVEVGAGMATGINPLGLASSDPYPQKKKKSSDNPFSVVGKAFTLNLNPSG
jgi:hypothetical protein